MTNRETLSTQLILRANRGKKAVIVPNLEELRRQFQAAPEYAMSQALTQTAQDGLRPQTAYLLLSENLGGAFRERFVTVALAMMPADQVLELFLILKKNKVNNRLATRVMLKYLWNQPYISEMIECKSGIIRDIIEHALGRNTARGAAAAIIRNPADKSALKTLSGGCARKADLIPEWIAQLYHAVPLPKVKRNRWLYKKQYLSMYETLIAATPEIKTVKVTARGDISSALVYIYQGATDTALWESANQAADKLAKRIPSSVQKVALVLDLSSSTKGSGDREYGCISQSVAFKMVLERVCNLTVFPVGGVLESGLMGNIPLAEGDTDLASALISALESKPDIVAIVSDGYENFMSGDLDFVIQSLPEQYVSIPITFIHSTFTRKDALDKRRPTTRLPELRFWHENDFQNVCAALLKNAELVTDESQREEQRQFLDSLFTMAQSVI